MTVKGNGVNLDQLEYTWFRLNAIDQGATVPNNAKLSDVKRIYFNAVALSGHVRTSATPTQAMEINWLRIVVNNNDAFLGTTSNRKYESELWAALVGQLGLPVSKSVNENKRTFYASGLTPILG